MKHFEETVSRKAQGCERTEDRWECPPGRREKCARLMTTAAEDLGSWRRQP